MNSQSSVTPNAVMYWDGGERAITPREKATIEEHSPSSFTIPLAPPVDVDNLLADCVPGGSITDPQVVADNIRAWFAKPAELAKQPSVSALGTSDGARCYIAHFFAREMRRHDFATYIATDLAADFACALAQHLAATGKQHVGDVHPDDAAVDAFAGAMKAKMADARAKGRGGWEDPAQCSAEDLARMLRDHVEKGDPRDVANFCMMLHQRGEAISAQVGEVQGDALVPVQPRALAASIAELEALMEGECLDPLTTSESESVMLVLHELKRLQLVAASQPGAPVAWLIHWSHIPLEAPEVTSSASRVDAVNALTDPPRIEPLYGAAPAQDIDLVPRPMNTAPRDGTMIRLLVQFTEHATEDKAGPAWTIGARNDHNVGELEWGGWQFAGWCWTHDHFTEGKGTPVGWLPLIDGQSNAAPGVSQ